MQKGEAPVVPRKNKNTQPLVPKSYPLKNGRCEPSYSSPLQTNVSDRRIPPTSHIYCNIPAPEYSESSLPEPEEEFPPPPSPVSSSYSELRRAAQYQQDYATYGPSSQASGT
ncbi:hypothetical protein M8J77_011511 [Diaphorina citri]|nr:hypothetical protein M8J77_011511 [Diaphorina citri]